MIRRGVHGGLLPVTAAPLITLLGPAGWSNPQRAPQLPKARPDTVDLEVDGAADDLVDAPANMDLERLVHAFAAGW